MPFADASGNYADKTIKCSRCHQEFTFTVGEQKFFDEKDLKFPPGKCKNCRAIAKAEREGTKPDQVPAHKEFWGGDDEVGNRRERGNRR